MTENKPTRLNEVVSTFAPEGANDSKWFLAEHQLEQARMSVQIAHEVLKDIMTSPEDDKEREIAGDCESIVKAMRLDVLGFFATFLSCLSDTDVPERISRKEL